MCVAYFLSLWHHCFCYGCPTCQPVDAEIGGEETRQVEEKEELLDDCDEVFEGGSPVVVAKERSPLEKEEEITKRLQVRCPYERIKLIFKGPEQRSFSECTRKEFYREVRKEYRAKALGLTRTATSE